MKLTTTVMTGAFAVLAFAGCAANTPAGKLADQAGKLNQEAELRAHKYVSKCDNANLVLSVLGVKSQNTVYDFQNGDAGKKIQFFSVDNCDQSKLIGDATYSGTQNLGASVAADGKSRAIDLNYTKVIVTISSADLVTGLNSLPGKLVDCGHTDWVAGQGIDVTAVAGDATCAAVPKATQTYDIVYTDGQNTFFGLKDTAHNAESDPARPVQLDQTMPYSKM